MRYDHRILIGLTGAIGKMGPQSQLITNKVAFQIGHELGAELKTNGLIDPDMGAAEVWSVINKELDIDPQARTEKKTNDQGEETLEIEISACNICPKKVGKYALPGTACPVGGIFRGVANASGLMNIETAPDLVPGEICKITVQVKS